MFFRNCSILIFIIFAFIGSSRLCRAEDGRSTEFRQFVIKSLENIQTNSSLLVVSSNIFWMLDSETNQVDITEVSYLTSGESYRTICKWPKPLDGNHEWQGSYDGVQTATYTDRHKEIIYRMGQSPDEVVVPINPVLSHFIFLSRAGDSCSLCWLRINNVVRGEPLQLLKDKTIERIIKQNQIYQIYRFPGENLNGNSTYWDIEFDTNNPEIKKATQHVNQSNVRIEYSFSNYTNVSGTRIRFPMVIAMIDYHGSDIIMTQMTYVVSALANPDISENTFSIMKDIGSQAKQVFNADNEKFDKLPQRFDMNDNRYVVKRRIITIIFVGLLIAGIFVVFKQFQR